MVLLMGHIPSMFFAYVGMNGLCKFIWKKTIDLKIISLGGSQFWETRLVKDRHIPSMFSADVGMNGGPVAALVDLPVRVPTLPTLFQVVIWVAGSSVHIPNKKILGHIRLGYNRLELPLIITIRSNIYNYKLQLQLQVILTSNI